MITTIALILNFFLALALFFVLFHQTEKKTKRFIVSIFILSLITFGINSFDYVKNLHQPNIILDTIDNRYDRNPPTIISFPMKIKNVGNSKAKDVSAQYCFSLNDKTAIKKVTNKCDLEPLETVKVGEEIFKGDTLEKIWNGEMKLQLLLRVKYTKRFGKKETKNYVRIFKPNKGSPVFNSGWVISKKDDIVFNELFRSIFKE